MPNTRWVIAAAGLLLCAAVVGFAATTKEFAGADAQYEITFWETDDGLPQNSIIAMTQTRDGYLWLGTLNGLVRFDGIHFKVFDEGNTPELRSSRVVSLFEDSRRRLWIGTENAGIAVLDGGQFSGIGIGADTRGWQLSAACEDASGAVWLYCSDGRLWRCKDGATNLFHFGSERFSIEGVAGKRALILENSGAAWIGADYRLATYQPTGEIQSRVLPELRDLSMAGNLDFLLASRGGGFWRLGGGRIEKWRGTSQETAAGAYPWKNASVSAACEDLQGGLLVGTRGEGVFLFDATNHHSVLSTNEGLSHNLVLSLCVDREGTLWVGTDGGGLNRVKRQAFRVLEPTRGRVVQSVCEGADGALWVGFATIDATAPGAGLWKNGKWKPYGAAQGIERSLRRLQSVFVDAAGEVWAGTLGGLSQLGDEGFQRSTNVPAAPPFVRVIHQDRSNRLYVGTAGGLFRLEGRRWKLVSGGEGPISEPVRAVAEDSEGSLWIGTEGGGLKRIRDGQTTIFRKGPNELPSDTVSSLLIDEQGSVWVGTSGGLARFHAGQWARYNARDGLAGDNIGYLLEDGHGHLWIGSNAGLMRAAKSSLDDFAAGRTTNLLCRTYYKPDGLPTRECSQGSQPAACRARDGTLWFPTIKGLASVHPTRLHPNTNPPPVVIESVSIEGSAQDSARIQAALGGPIVVSPEKQRIEIQYTSLNLASPDRARFKYRLDGHEDFWTDVGGERVARYRKLLPGRYRFQVTACNEDGLWNEAGATLAIVVLPPFWRTWWFLTLSAIVILSAIAGVVHYFSTQKLQRQVAQLRQQEAVEKERARIARDIHDQVGANLTQVSLLGELVQSDKDSPADVEDHAKQITQAARETTRALDEIVWTVNPSNDTLEGLVNYVCKNAQDLFGVAGLRHRIDAPPELPATPIPPDMRHNVFLAARESITNVVRHAQATAAWLRVRLEPGRFVIEIEDNGRGLGDISAKAHRSGLRNMRKRMEDVGGDFSIGPGPEGGTLVRLIAPIAKH